MARVLVTGATGFVGYHLIQALAARGDEITCLVRKTSKIEHLAPWKTAQALGDVTVESGLGEAVADKDIVFHVAGCTTALSRGELFRVNEQGARNIARACAQQPNPPVLVVVSSLAAAGPSSLDRPKIEEDEPQPVSNYGKSKRAGELAATEFADKVPISVIRPPIVFGERDIQVAEMFRAIRRMRAHVVPGWKRRRFSLIHAEDLATAMLLAAEKGKRLSKDNPSQGIYFVAGDEQPSYGELGRLIGRQISRPKCWIVPIPMPLVWCFGLVNETLGRIRRKPFFLNVDKIREAAAGSWTCSTRRAQDELGFRVTASLDERLKQTAQWYFREGWIR